MASRILLEELQIPSNIVKLGMGPDGLQATNGSLSNAEYKQKIHPSGYVPALVLKTGVVITENPSVLTYVASLKPERELLGTTSVEHARVLEWLVWLSATLHGSGFGAYWRPARFIDDEAAHTLIEKKGREIILRCFDRIEQRVDGRHAVGDKLTVVDVYLHVFYRWGNEIGVDMDKYPRFQELVRETEKLKSVQAIMAREGYALLSNKV